MSVHSKMLLATMKGRGCTICIFMGLEFRYTYCRCIYMNLCLLWGPVKHRGGSVFIGGCMSAKGVGEMTFIDGTMNACEFIVFT